MLTPYLPEYLTAILHHLGALFPVFYHYYVVSEDTAPSTSEDERVDLTQLAGSSLDFISAVARSGRAKEWFTEANTRSLVAEAFRWIEMTADEVLTFFEDAQRADN